MTDPGTRAMNDDELLRRYLLGGLSGDEKDRLESRLIRESSLFELAEAVEDEILDDYSHGLLDAAERIRVERRLLAKPEGRSRLALIQGLGKLAAEQEREETGKILPWRMRSLSRPQRRFAAIAAMLLIGVGAAWLVQQTAPLPDEAAAPQVAKRLETPAPPSPAPSPTPAPVPQQDKLAEREATPVPAPSAPSKKVFVYTLAATVFRGEEEMEQVTIPAGFEQIELRVGFKPGDYASYETVLIDTEQNREVLQTSRIEGGEVLVLQLDSNQLHDGIYAIQAEGIPAEGEPELLIERELEIRMPAK